jgi:hypothetical protein
LESAAAGRGGGEAAGEESKPAAAAVTKGHGGSKLSPRLGKFRKPVKTVHFFRAEKELQV